MPNVTLAAIVVRYANYRDNDRMLTLLTPGQGRVDVLARGCRRPRSPLLGASELFCTGEYLLYAQRDKATLTSCAIHDSFYPLRLDMARLTYGTYLLNLSEAAAQPGAPCEELFHLLIRALSRLCYTDCDRKALLGGFLAHYADALGYRPRLRHCVQCGRRVEGMAPVAFDIKEGGVLCPGCRHEKAVPITNAQLAWLADALGEGLDGWMALPQQDAPVGLLREFVETRLERPVKSGKLLE